MKIKLNIDMAKKLIYFQIIYNLLIKFFISELNFSTIFNYVTDIITLLLFLCVFKKFKKYIKKSNSEIMLYAICIYTVFIIIGIIFNLVPLQLVFWGFRNVFRFFVFFFACIVALDKNDIYKVYKILFNFQILNLVLVIYQYFFLGYIQDGLGGIFGNGGNGGNNIFFCVILTMSASKYLSKEETLIRFLFIISSTLFISALAEMKFFFFETIIICILLFVFNKFSFKTIILLCGIIISLIVFINLFKSVFPRWYDEMIYSFSSIDTFLDFAGATGGGYNISRTNVFNQINDIFFDNNLLKKIFGFGLGNCEMSSISMFTSDFYNMYGYYNYRFFASAMNFIETGYSGFISYCLFFIACFWHSRKYKNNIKVDDWINTTVMILSIIGLIVIFLDNTIRTENAYIYFTVISFAAVQRKSFNT